MNRNTAILAAAAGALFLASVPAHAAEGSKTQVKCEGVNSCKGHSDCKSAQNDCAGKNSCKGKGGCKVPVDASHMDSKHECKSKDKDKSGCSGKNACKGQGGCATKDHKCAGQNACKGQGGCAVPAKKKGAPAAAPKAG